MTTDLRPRLDAYETQTPPEREVLHFTGEGLTNIEFAVHLHISVQTVEFHLESVRKKLRISSRFRLIRYVLMREHWPLGNSSAQLI